jgi:hypothetical protein
LQELTSLALMTITVLGLFARVIEAWWIFRRMQFRVQTLANQADAIED